MNMQARTVPLAVFAFLCLAIMGEALYYSPMLPERIATQFGFDGMPNNWEDKSKFVFDLAGFLALLGIAFAAAELILRGIARVPGGLFFCRTRSSGSHQSVATRQSPTWAVGCAGFWC